MLQICRSDNARWVLKRYRRADLAAMPLTLCHAWCDDDEDVVADRKIDAVMRAGTGDTAVEGSPGPGFGAWPGIVPGLPWPLPQARPVAAGPGRDGQPHGDRARRRRQGGVPMAAEPWATPGMRPRLLPPPCVTHRLGGSVILKNASPGQPWPAPPPSRQRTTPGAHPAADERPQLRTGAMIEG